MLDQYKANTYYLVRHGEAENNVLGILNSFSGQTEYLLTAHGRSTIQLTAQFLQSHQPHFIVSSPVLRTRETALIIQDVLGIPLTIDQRLCENHFGKFEGRQLQAFLEYVRSRGGRLEDIAEAGIEGYTSIRERAQAFLVDVVRHCSGEKIVIVSHGDLLQEMYSELLGESVGAEQGEGGWYPKKGSCAVISATHPPQFFVPMSD